jgi:hypothetical protein
MVKMVDSRDQKLGKVQIVAISLQNTDSEFPPDVALPAIVTEMAQPNTKTQRFGNTIFVLHMGEDGGGVFKAYNADTAQNFMLNSILFLKWAKSQGMHTLVTDFNDPNIYRMIKMIAARPPMPGMGFEAFKLKDGGMRVGINLGE